MVKAGRDTVNQFDKVARWLIRITSREIDEIAQKQIQQAVNQDGRKFKRVTPKNIKIAIEKFCETPFRLLKQFEIKKYHMKS